MTFEEESSNFYISGHFFKHIPYQFNFSNRTCEDIEVLDTHRVKLFKENDKNGCTLSIRSTEGWQPRFTINNKGDSVFVKMNSKDLPYTLALWTELGRITSGSSVSIKHFNDEFLRWDCQVENFNGQIRKRIKNVTIKTYVGNDLLSASSEGARFNANQIGMIKGLDVTTIVIADVTVAAFEGGMDIKMEPFVFVYEP